MRSVPQLIGKPAGVFFSTGTQNGGQETTALTFVTQLTHHGMLFVPMGYSTPLLFDLDPLALKPYNHTPGPRTHRCCQGASAGGESVVVVTPDLPWLGAGYVQAITRLVMMGP